MYSLVQTEQMGTYNVELALFNFSAPDKQKYRLESQKIISFEEYYTIMTVNSCRMSITR